MDDTLTFAGMAASDDRALIENLVRAAAGGDARAWAALVERFSGLVWSVARAHCRTQADAAEVGQIAWLRLVENLDRLREPAKVGGWLAAVTRRECFRVMRSAGHELLVDAAPDVDQSQANDVDVNLLAGERAAALWRALERLPPQWRLLLRVLIADPQPSYEEVAAALDIPIGSIGPTRQRCLERLRDSPELQAWTRRKG